MRDYEREPDEQRVVRFNPDPVLSNQSYLEDFEGRQSMLKSLQINRKELAAELEQNSKTWKQRLDNCQMQASLLRQQADVIDEMGKMISLHLAGDISVAAEDPIPMDNPDKMPHRY